MAERVVSGGAYPGENACEPIRTAMKLGNPINVRFSPPLLLTRIASNQSCHLPTLFMKYTDAEGDYYICNVDQEICNTQAEATAHCAGEIAKEIDWTGLRNFKPLTKAQIERQSRCNVVGD